MKIPMLAKPLTTCCLAALLGGWLAPQTSLADEVITSLSGTLDISMTNGTYGYSFTVGNQPVSVTALGIYDPNGGTGLLTSHDVGLWTSSGTLLGSVTIPAGNASSLSASGFRYESITPVVLAANTSYVLGAEYGTTGVEYGISHATATTSSDITYGTPLFYESASSFFNFPTFTSAPRAEGFFGPDAQFAPVPEPGSAVLLALGLLGLVRASSRTSRRATAGADR